MDACFDFMICDVPSEEVGYDIAEAIKNLLSEKFGTDIYIYPSFEG